MHVNLYLHHVCKLEENESRVWVEGLLKVTEIQNKKRSFNENLGDFTLILRDRLKHDDND